MRWASWNSILVMQCMHAINLLPAETVIHACRVLRLPPPRASPGETLLLGIDFSWPIFAGTVSTHHGCMEVAVAEHNAAVVSLRLLTPPPLSVLQYVVLWLPGAITLLILVLSLDGVLGARGSFPCISRTS